MKHFTVANTPQKSPAKTVLASPEFDVAAMERELLRGDGMFLTDGKEGVAAYNSDSQRSDNGVAAYDAPTSGSLGGVLSHMMDNVGHPSSSSSSASASAPNSSRPPLAPSNAKRKREEHVGKEGDSATHAPARLSALSDGTAPALGECERRQAALLERQLYQELETGLLAGFFSNPSSSAGGTKSAFASSPDSHSSALQAVGPGRNMRAASPNSMSIASVLSLLASNCLHHYNNSMAASGDVLESGPLTPLSSIRGGDSTSAMGHDGYLAGKTEVSSVHGGGVTGSVGTALVDGIASSGHCVLDTSITSEESDESSQFGRPALEGVSSSQLSSCSSASAQSQHEEMRLKESMLSI